MTELKKLIKMIETMIILKIFYQKVLTITFENVTIYLVSLLDKQTIKEEENEK